MELRLYWKIIRRRLWLIVGLLAVVGASYLLYAPQATPSYVATMRFVVGIQPQQAPPDVYTYDRYYTWLTAEYLVDDLAEVVKSQAFAADVANLAGVSLPVGAIQGATAAGKLHRILTVSVTWPNQEELARIANAIEQNLAQHGGKYFAQLSTDPAIVSVIDAPTIFQPGPSLRQRLDLPLRLMLALMAGILAAFLLDYLDTMVREPADLEQLGLPIIAEIPATSRWVARWRQSRYWRGRRRWPRSQP